MFSYKFGGTVTLHIELLYQSCLLAEKGFIIEVQCAD